MTFVMQPNAPNAWDTFYYGGAGDHSQFQFDQYDPTFYDNTAWSGAEYNDHVAMDWTSSHVHDTSVAFEQQMATSSQAVPLIYTNPAPPSCSNGSQSPYPIPSHSQPQPYAASPPVSDNPVALPCFSAALNTKTAVIEDKNDLPITYLNRGQDYSLTIKHTKPQNQAQGSVEYRTYVRIAFDQESQGASPSDFWALWKTLRGEKKLRPNFRALGYVGFCQAYPESRDNTVTLERQNFDGFSVRWTASSTGEPAECRLLVRLNFLSTEFSNTIGVKGMPVRLLLKNEMISGDSFSTTEISFCRIKLFRSHGAERKTQNDIAHLERNIAKLKERSKQPKSKQRKAKAIEATKHQSSPPVSPLEMDAGSEDDLGIKTRTLKNLLRSIKEPSLFSPSPREQNDPELSSVDFENLAPLESIEESKAAPRLLGIMPSLSRETSNGGSVYSPVSSPCESNLDGYFQTSPASDRGNESADQANRTSRSPVKSEDCTDMFRAAPSHMSHPEQFLSPVACFRVQLKSSVGPMWDSLQAIYLYDRTLEEFVNAVAALSFFEPSLIQTVVRIDRDGGCTTVDDSTILQIPEGQPMRVEIVVPHNNSFAEDDSSRPDPTVGSLLVMRY